MHLQTSPIYSFLEPRIVLQFALTVNAYPSILISWHQVINNMGSKKKSVKVTKREKDLSYVPHKVVLLNVNRCE